MASISNFSFQIYEFFHYKFKQHDNLSAKNTHTLHDVLEFGLTFALMTET